MSMRLDPHHPKLIDSSIKQVTLIPNSGLQFLDYAVDLGEARKISLRFYEQASARSGERSRVSISLMEPEETGDDEPLLRSMESGGPHNVDAEETYAIRGSHAIDRFAGRWLPVPFFNLHDPDGPDGPTNWARIHVSPPPTDAPPEALYRIVLAFDTEVLARSTDRPYAAPEPRDVMDKMDFCWVEAFDRQLGFAIGEWQGEWIEREFERTAKRRRHPDDEDDEGPLMSAEAFTTYVTLLQTLQSVLKFPRVILRDIGDGDAPDVRTNADKDKIIDAALVIDIGNSRTCGILVEQSLDDDNPAIGEPAARLELRNLSHPAELTHDPFESRVEFQPASFGYPELGRKSGRSSGKDAFWWPCPVRTGPEAAWLRSLTDGRDGISGMSSPKRYVWDTKARPQSWINNRAGRPIDQPVPRIKSPVSAQLKQNGQRIREGDKEGLALDILYSRSSLYALMLAEVICHALTQINSYSHRQRRANTDMPRRLTQIFLTLPSATPIAEQRRMRKLANDAVALVWTAYGWSDRDWLHPKPRLVLEFDEATCTQLVYLYNELEYRFREVPGVMFGALSRTGDAGKLRIASVDFGGGTTDLMIIEHRITDDIITPKQLFREGFRQAGDDVLKRIIEDGLLKQIMRAMDEAGVEKPWNLINELFSGDTADTARVTQVNRALFVNEVLVPAGLALLAQYETTDARFPENHGSQTLGELLDHSVSDAILGYVDEAVRQKRQVAFSVLDTPVVLDVPTMDGAVSSVLGHAIEDFCDVVRAYECDILLLSGRPIAMPAIRDRIRACGPVPPSRIVPMYGYQVGNWYPFRSDDLRIWDGKTTTAVGALLCFLCEGKFASFRFQSRELQLESTARYIGKMDPRGRITAGNVAYERDSGAASFSVSMGSGADIGYRQLPIERWVTSQLYRLSYVSEKKARDIPVPVTVTLEFKNDPEGEEIDATEAIDKRWEQSEKDQFAREELELVEAVDATGKNCDIVRRTLQTTRTVDKLDAGYWFDSGVLTTSELVSDNDSA